MTLPTTGRITVGDINVEVGLARSYTSKLTFLNNKIKSSQRPVTPHMAGFYGKAYYQRTMDGNCTNNGANCDYNCNCNCGNIQCNNCANCTTVNCANCDTQAWLQTNCNCNCTYNCNSNQNCYSYNCNCACACSKIICTKLHELGMMDNKIFVADQQYGEWLKKNDRVVYKGYIRWAKIVTGWMSGDGPDFMIWIRDKEERREKQKIATTKWAYKIATPWSLHMAYLMGATKKDDIAGRVTMAIGRQICKYVNKFKFKPNLVSSWMMWMMAFVSYFISSTYAKIHNKINEKQIGDKCNALR